MDAAKTPDAASGANDLTKNNPMAVDSHSRGNPTVRTQDSTGAKTKERIISEPVKEASTLTLSTTKTAPMAIDTKAPASTTTTTTTEKAVMVKDTAISAIAAPKDASKDAGQKVTTKANATVPASSGTQNAVNSGNDRVTVDKIHQPLVPSAPSTPAMATPVAKMHQNISIRPPSESTTPTPASKAMAPSLASARPSHTTATTNATGTAVIVTEAPLQTPAAHKPNVAVTPKTQARVGDPSQPQSQPTRTPSGTTDASKSDPSTPAAAAAPTEHDHDGEPVVMDEETLLEEATRKVRAPLVDPYAPYIIPSDTTLADARQRLHTALNQTRKLRAAFTERVYGKYRVCLQPTPTTDQILKTILADSAGTCARLEIEIKALKEEKDIEKKEAQKLNAELMAANNNNNGNNNAGDGTNTAASSMNADNAEQLMYITAGLSLVILPEKDASGVDMSTYPDRAPINPETGQRVRSISSAAAAAGEVMLDRARKAAAMREERKRRQQLQLLAGDDQESESNNYSRLSVLSSTTVPLHVIPVATAATTTVHVKQQVPAAPRVAPIAPATTVAPVLKAAAAAVQPKPLAPLMPTILPVKTLSRRPSVTKAAISPASTAASAKQLRARMQASMTSQTLLSLQPSADELRTDGKHSAATIAMIDRGVGQHGANNRISQQQRYSHPFPESVGGRARAMNPAGVKKEVAPAAQSHPFSQPAYLSLALPPIPTAKERRTRKRIPVLDNRKACSSRARLAIHSVLDQFFSNKNANPMDGPADTSEDSRPTRPTKRRITEISFMLGMQKFGESNEKVPDSGDTLLSNAFSSQGIATSSMEPKSIDPVFAFNVLQAVGFVNATDRDDGVESRNFQSLIDPSLFRAFEQNADSEEGAQSRRSVAKLKSLWKKFSTRKRTFTDAFLEASNEEQRVSVSVEQRQSPRVNKEKPSGDGDRIEQKYASTMETSLAEAEETPFDKMITERVGEEKTVENDVVPTQAPEAKQAPPVVAIRGGGEVILDSSEGSNKAQNAGQPPTNGSERKPAEAPGDARRDQSSGQDRQQQRNPRAANTRMQDMPGQAQSTGQMRAPDMSGHRMVWEDPSRQSLVLLNPRLSGNDTGYGLAPGSHQTPLTQHGSGGASGARMQGQLPDHYHHHSTANALQLAHHLRHATASIARMPPHGHQPAGDLADYIGGLHHSQAPGGYDWSSLGAASAAAVASAHSSLAALGLSPHRAAMVNYSVQDRARALIAREQQTAAAAHAAAAHRQNMSSQQAVAFLGGAGNHGYAPSASPHFPHLAGHSAATAALLNSSAALMGHSGMQQVSTAPPVPSSAPRVQQAKADQRPSQASKKEQSKKEQRSKKEQAPRKEQASKKEQPSEKEQSSKSDEGSVQTSKGSDEKMNDEDTSAADSLNSKKRKLSDSENGPVKQGKRLAVTAEPAGSRKDWQSENDVVAAKENDYTGKSNPTTTPKETRPVLKIEDNKTTVSQTSDAKATPKVQKAEAEPSAVSASKSEGSSSVQAMDVIIPKESAPVADANMDDSVAAVQPSTGGMQFFVPPAPPSIGSEVAGLVLSANCHEAVDIVESNGTPAHGAALVEYLISVGNAVPIPKALVANPLKERLSTGGVGAKNATNNGMHALTRDVVVATILLWLWKHHEDCFQRAFAKSGRIDVDPECKWIIHAAVDSSVRSLTLEAADPAVRGMSPLAAALAAHRSKGHAGQKGGEAERSQSSTKLDMLTASIVSKDLMAGSSVDEQMDSIIPHFHDLVQYLDECRKCALHSKSQERALLAALISRKATMSLPFSHAYVSSMVRAGEALGHGELFEVVQNEEVLVSTMIPYDVFTDESGAWEDPCRPTEGYTSGLTGDDLMRRAHARAMIQKSLKKLQDRHNIKGGTPNTGPYTDPPNSQSGFGNTSDSNSKSVSPNAATNPRGWVKRQKSFSEPPVQPGTGSAAATSWSLYDPRHYSAPLIWRADDVENSPYGRHSKSTRPRSLSLSQVGIRHSASRSTKGKPGGRSMSVASYESAEPGKDSSGDLRSTREIAWTEIAGIFQPVNLPGESKAQKEKEETASAPETKQIFAPFVRTVESSPVASEEESDEEEDLTDDTVLGRHQIVLDRMKEKLSAILEARKKQQDRKKASK